MSENTATKGFPVIKMEKLATLFATMVVGLGTALAQGTIDFHNPNTQPLRVYDAAGNLTIVGAPGSPLGPASVRVALFVGNPGATFAQMTMVGLTTNSSSTLPLFVGTFNGGNPFPVPGRNPGDTVSFAFVAWSVSTGALTYQAALTATAGYVSLNPQVGGPYTLGGGAATPPLTFGTGSGQVQGFSLNIPEPSPMALGLLGGVGLLLRRRK